MLYRYARGGVLSVSSGILNRLVYIDINTLQSQGRLSNLFSHIQDSRYAASSTPRFSIPSDPQGSIVAHGAVQAASSISGDIFWNPELLDSLQCGVSLPPPSSKVHAQQYHQPHSIPFTKSWKSIVLPLKSLKRRGTHPHHGVSSSIRSAALLHFHSFQYSIRTGSDLHSNSYQITRILF